MRKLIILFLLVPIFLAIYIFYKQHYSPHTIKLKNIKAPIQLERAEKKLFTLQTQAEVKAWLENNPLLKTEFFGLESDKDLQAMSNKLATMVQHPAMQQLYQEVQHTFKDLSPLIKELEYAYKCLAYYYPTCKMPTIVTLITGLQTDLYVSEDLIVIGLDFFLGDGATWRPRGVPDYILQTYQPSCIAPKIILALSHYFNKQDTASHTLLSDMLYQGKSYYFAKTLLPTLPESTLLGYTPAQWEDTRKHQDIVWKHFIDRELFYEINPLVKRKYIGASPFTSEIGPGCPGNIGGWLGFEIIKSYMKHHPQTALPAVMQNDHTQQLFEAAKYKPRAS